MRGVIVTCGVPVGGRTHASLPETAPAHAPSVIDVPKNVCCDFAASSLPMVHSLQPMVKRVVILDLLAVTSATLPTSSLLQARAASNAIGMHVFSSLLSSLLMS